VNFDIWNLITLGIVAGALLVYRFLDRDNRSLEKVKKYADRLKDELAAFVDQRQASLKDFSIELDVRQKAAKEVLVRVREIEEGLNSRSDALDAVGKRIGEYDRVLDELMGMTERADENLRRIREESAFADQVAKKLKEAESRLESIATGIPGLVDDFKRVNGEGLAALMDDISSRVEERVDAAADAASEAAKHAAKAADEAARLDAARAAKARDELSALEEAFQSAFQRARKEAERREDAAFGKLSESITGRAQKLQEALEEKYQGLQAFAKEGIQETQALVRDFRAEFQAESEALSGKNAELASRIAAAEAASAASLAKLDADLRAREAALADRAAVDCGFDASPVARSARVADGAAVVDSVIGEQCEVGAGAEVAASVLLPGARVEAGARITDAVVLCGEVLKA